VTGTVRERHPHVAKVDDVEPLVQRRDEPHLAEVEGQRERDAGLPAVGRTSMRASRVTSRPTCHPACGSAESAALGAAAAGGPGRWTASPMSRSSSTV
jgi:hypothetical protein